MAVTTIHVHTQVDRGTVPYAKFMWETMVALATRPESLVLTVHCMGPSSAGKIDAHALFNCRTMITPNVGNDPLNGSRGHGACVMEALRMTGDGSIHVIADSDTVVIARGWDEYLRARLINSSVRIMGSTYEELGGFSSGDSRTQTYKGVPSLTWCALSPHHDWRSLDVTPSKEHIIAISNPTLSEIYNLPIGYSVFGEVGWQIPQYVYDHKLTYEGLRQLKPSRNAVVLKGLSDYHEEFHVGSIPFIAHHRGSMRHAYRGDKMSQRFYETIDKHLESELTVIPRFDWVDSGTAVPTFNLKVTPSSAEETPVAAAEPEVFIPQGNEWIKVTFNGKVICPRCPAVRTKEAKQLTIEPPASDRLGHMRVEGNLEHDFTVALPPVTSIPYMITVRNATGAALKVTSDRGQPVLLPSGCTWFLLVDVDGVQYVG